jgi:hypothetical protein
MMTPARDNIRRCAATPTHVDQRESELIVVEGPLQPYTPMYGKKKYRRGQALYPLSYFSAHRTGSVRQIVGRST